MAKLPAPDDATHGHCIGMTDALRRLREGRLGPPTARDVPPPSAFPMALAARAALRFSRTHLRGLSA